MGYVCTEELQNWETSERQNEGASELQEARERGGHINGSCLYRVFMLSGLGGFLSPSPGTVRGSLTGASYIEMQTERRRRGTAAPDILLYCRLTLLQPRMPGDDACTVRTREIPKFDSPPPPRPPLSTLSPWLLRKHLLNFIFPGKFSRPPDKAYSTSYSAEYTQCLRPTHPFSSRICGARLLFAGVERSNKLPLDSRTSSSMVVSL